MRKLGLGLVVMGLALNAAHADIYSDIAACKKTEGDAKQLECFKALPDQDTQKTEIKGVWSKDVKKSPIDDSPKVILLTADMDSRERALMVRCLEGTPDVLFITGGFFGLSNNNGITVTARFDSEKSTDSKWDMGAKPDGTLFAPDGKAFIKTMLKHEKLVTRVFEYSGNAITSTFNISGLADVMTEFNEACKM